MTSGAEQRAEGSEPSGRRPTPPISRVVRSKEEAQASYNKLSRWYDLVAEPFEGKYREIGLEMLNPRPGERLLELGPGTGHGVAAMAKSVGPSGRVAALDISMGMLSQTKSRLDRQDIERGAQLICGDAARLPLAGEVFDGLFASFTLELFDTPEIQAVLDRCRWTLKEGGRFALVSMAKEQPANLMTRMYEWFHQHFPRYADCRPIWPVQELERAGFQVIRDRRFSMVGLPVAVVLAVKL
ncbi:MAG: class I SAM-dependent methyltransferase [Anaerolineales bacterium]